jgi:hypothetical protein
MILLSSNQILNEFVSQSHAQNILWLRSYGVLMGKKGDTGYRYAKDVAISLEFPRSFLGVNYLINSS